MADPYWKIKAPPRVAGEKPRFHPSPLAQKGRLRNNQASPISLSLFETFCQTKLSASLVCTGRFHFQHTGNRRLLWMLLSFLEAVPMRSLRSALFVFLISVVSVVPMLAQTSTTSVRGTITDQSGALVPGAQISLTNTADNSVTNGTSDKSGLFVFPQLAPATYLITVTAPGFAPSTKQAQLLVNQPATINFELGVQATQTINVSAEA
jgi:hypothetical protein